MTRRHAFKPSGNLQKVRIALRLLDLRFEEIVPSGGALPAEQAQ